MSRCVFFCALLLVAGKWKGSLALRSASVTKLSSGSKFGVDISHNLHREFKSQQRVFAARKTIVLERETDTFLVSGSVDNTWATYVPLNAVLAYSKIEHNHGVLAGEDTHPICAPSRGVGRRKETINSLWAISIAWAPLLIRSGMARAEAAGSVISKNIMNPASFQPVCPASDNFYRFLQTAVEAVVGRDKFIEYGPLIAGGLLRVRLELCVVESFFNEAVGPFINENGVSWILPLHESVETFLAGSIFALATTFILVGSTKLLTVITTYFDLLVGLPFRIFGGFFYDRALGRPVTLDFGLGPFKTRLFGPSQEVLQKMDRGEELVDLSNPLSLLIVLTSGTVQLVGKTSGFVREFLEAIDLFVGRYLVFLATFYIGAKFLHFKVFPDFP